MYHQTLSQMKKTLGQLDLWLVAAGEFAATKKFDPSIISGLRLAPDQFAFSRQVRTACDTAEAAASRLSGRDAPASGEDAESLEALRARVQSVIAYLDGFTEADFEGAGQRQVTQPRWKGEYMFGADYLREHALPNFYFHTTTAYAILRHNGFPLGKRDFLGPLSKQQP